jgi:DNA-binding MarR family transcriptional regulator
MISRRRARGTHRAFTARMTQPDDVIVEIARRRALEDETCARLLAQAQVLRRDLTRRAWEANLAPTDFLALRQMLRSPYPFSPSEIARVLECGRSNATKVLQRLEAAGYIETSVSVFAPKSKSLSVTFAGKQAYARAHRRYEPVQRFTRLSEKELGELYRLLGLVGPRLRDSTPVG